MFFQKNRLTLPAQIDMDIKMDREYSVPIKGLKIGKHHYNFSIGDTFFDNFENSLIHKAAIEIDTALEKSESWIKVVSRFQGNVCVDCDRCLDELILPVEAEASLLVRLVRDEGEENDDIETVNIDPSETVLDLSQFFYDYIILSLPAHMVHAEGLCDPEMILRLKMAEGEHSSSDDVSPFFKLNELLNL